MNALDLVTALGGRWDKGRRHAYLISSAWSWAEATRALITRKTYGGAP